MDDKPYPVNCNKAGKEVIAQDTREEKEFRSDIDLESHVRDAMCYARQFQKEKPTFFTLLKPVPEEEMRGTSLNVD